MYELVWWALQPSSLLALTLALAFGCALLGWRGGARGALALALALLAAVALLPLDHWLAAPLEGRVAPPATLPPRVDGVVVLGGAVEWRVSRARDQLAFNDAGERLLAAAALARRFPRAELLLTGVYRDALPHDFVAEPDAASLLFGPELAGATFLGEARSTYEEALLALERARPGPGERWLLVTSALHMPRALAVFETLGWTLQPYPVDYRTDGEARFGLRPSIAHELAELDRAVREWGALEVYRRSGRIAAGVGGF